MQPSAALVSLGCAKNHVDSEVMAAQLQRQGYTITPDVHEATLILVNTCGFLESAVEEALATVLELAQHKVSGHCKTLIAAGCMVQRYGKKLLSLLPEVDFFLGTSHFYQLAEILEGFAGDNSRRLWIAPPRFLYTSDHERIPSTPFFSAYVKIAEGCSNRCTFCMIPRLRGPLRSRTSDDVTTEVHGLAQQGVREINLIAQDTTAFGLDRKGEESLLTLLERLEQINAIEWIRILYAYPERITDELLQMIAKSKKIIPYLDIPLQHCQPGILKAMGRWNQEETPEDLIARIRAMVPEITLRTSLIAGFPGETEYDFRRLLAFVENIEFDHLGVFEFSPERGVTAGRMHQQVSTETKRRRRELLLELQREISRRKLETLVGRCFDAIVEGLHPETHLLLTGRLATQAPEVDGSLIITKGEGRVGDIVSVRITAAYDYDLEAEIVGKG
jgi:ribosomal protein S12 methylthiotransferase